MANQEQTFTTPLLFDLQQSATKAATADRTAQIVIYAGTSAEDPRHETNIWNSLITSGGAVLATAAWPVCLTILAIAFKSQLNELIGRLRSMKGPGFELSAEDQINELPQTPLARQNEGQDPVVDDAAYLAPIDAVVTAWVSVEKAIRKLAEDQTAFSIKAHPSRAVPLRRLLDQLTRTGVIRYGLSQEIIILNQIRNTVVHDLGERLSAEAVKTYVANANFVLTLIDSNSVKD